MKHWKRRLSVLLLSIFALTACQKETAETEADTAAQTEETTMETTAERKVIPMVDAKSLGEAYTLIENTGYNGHKEGIASGWELDNRGGIPRTQIEGGYGSLTDISSTAGTAMIRRLNKVTDGLLVLETSATVGGSFDGFSLEFRNEADQVVYKAVTKNGGWVYAGTEETVLLENKENAQSFTFRVVLSLADNCATTYINEENCGTYPLATTGDASNLAEFRFATDEASTASVSLGGIRLTANYAVNTNFDRYENGKLPYDWTGSGAAIDGGTLRVTAGEAVRTVDPIPGIVIGETEFQIPKAGVDTTFALRCGEDPVVNFTSEGANFYANGQLVYENYVPQLWYRLRLEANLAGDEAVIWLNGRKIATVPLLAETGYIDTVAMSNAHASPVKYDEVRLFEKILHEDYVPAPVRPKGEEYMVGLNVCPLWKEGTHFGWACTTPFRDADLVLGYYDEGTPETADWEIKYLVEHGVDFQAFCWYASADNAPIHNNHLENHLHDGYMYAEYSDQMQYCLIWEAANAASPRDMNAWKTYYVPYLIENYLKDERYVAIDNQPVLCVFGANKIAEKLGSNAAVKEIFDYLEEEVKKLGFDGMIYLSCGSSSDALAEMGFNGSYAYNWGTSGYQLEVNKNSILSSARVQSMYTVPTISVGFNSIPWHGVRYPMMSVADYEAANLWVRDEYLPTYAEKGTWQEKFVMLSTWNEYGEGTYIMPSAGNGGFGYLDTLRKVYTGEQPDESLNLVPTDAQKARINHIYPQHHYILRKTGYYDTVAHSVLSERFTIDYAGDNSVSASSVGNGKSTSQGYEGYVNGDALIIKSGLNVPAVESPFLRVTLDVPKGTKVEVFFITDQDGSWTQNKSGSFTADQDGKGEYIIDMSVNGAWKDNITAIRVDPGQTATGAGTPGDNWFVLRSLEFLSDPNRTIYINDQAVDMQLYMEEAEDGQRLMAFDPKIALDFRLNLFHRWKEAKGELTLYGDGHTMVFTVGKDTYVADGAEKSLGFTLYRQDGLPMLPIEAICKTFGFTCTWEEETLHITTAQEAFFDSISDRVPGQWEFNTNGDAESWHSGSFQLTVLDGTMLAKSIDDNRDPIISRVEEVNLEAARYDRVEIRCRYKYDSGSNDHISLYFTTDTDGTMSETMSIKLPLSTTDTGDEWETITANLTTIESWAGTIKSIRFDPFNAVGQMEVDYIRFLPKE